MDGLCGGSNPVACSPLDGCHLTGTCDPLSGCSNPPIGGVCSTSLAAVALTGDAQHGYTAPVTIGTQTFQLLVDSTSSDVAVASASCASCANASPKYAPGAGATHLSGGPTSVTYGDGGGWIGDPYRDQVTVGSASVPLAVSAITSQSMFLPSDNAFQGALGLGGAALVAAPDEPFLDTWAGAGGTYAYSIELCDAGGKLWMGGYDPSALGTGLQYTPLTTTFFDEITATGLSVGATPLAVSSADFGQVFPATATTNLVFATAVYTKLKAFLVSYSATHSLGGSFNDGSGWFDGICFQVDAATRAAWPTLTLTLPNADGGASLGVQIASDAYLRPVSVGSAFYCLDVSDGSASTLLGAPFFFSNVTVFDKENSRLGTGRAASCP